MSAQVFTCDCGKISGEVRSVPSGGLHLECFCDYCRAGANHCGEGLAEGEPVDLYLTPPHNVTVSKGIEHLSPFAFSPKGIVRWQAGCCGVQMFSSQPSPKIAFMSISAARFAEPQALGPVKTKSFVPLANGKTAQQGKRGLAKLIFAAVSARLTGQWRKTPLYDAATLKPILSPTLLSKDDRRALL